jgi:hypothetical protein
MNIVIVIAPSFMTVEKEEVCGGFSPKPFGLSKGFLWKNPIYLLFQYSRR